jgi:DNA-binding response OmpR family regulator
MKILLVEDDKFFQKFYAFKLKEQNFEIDMAGDGAEGIVKMQQNPPNIVLLDLIMPNKDGFEFLAEKAKIPAIAGIPVIVFSTLGQEQDIERAKKLGAKEYVNKSFFDFETLLAKINAVLKGP